MQRQVTLQQGAIIFTLLVVAMKYHSGHLDEHISLH